MNEIRKLVNIETKRFDITAAAFGTSQAGTVGQLNNMAQGADFNQRVGDSIRTQRLQFKAHVKMAAAATQTVVRVIIFRDHENTGTAAAPVGSDLLTRAGNPEVVCSPYNYFNYPQGPMSPGRFTVLYDEAVTLSITGEQNAYLNHDVPLSQHARYSGTAAANTREGALMVLFYCNEAVNTATADWCATLWYTDD